MEELIFKEILAAFAARFPAVPLFTEPVRQDTVRPCFFLEISGAQIKGALSGRLRCNLEAVLRVYPKTGDKMALLDLAAQAAQAMKEAGALRTKVSLPPGGPAEVAGSFSAVGYQTADAPPRMEGFSVQFHAGRKEG